MKLSPAARVLWSMFLVLWILHHETEGSICLVEKEPDEILVQNSDGLDDYQLDVEEHLVCLLYRTNTLNCSWSFPPLPEDTQLSVAISICDGETTLDSLHQLSVDTVGSASWPLSEDKMDFTIVRFNMTLGDEWTAHTHVFSVDTQRLLPPPGNISASVKDGSLFVRWDRPHTELTTRSACFQYQLDLGAPDLVTVKDREYHEVPIADPYRTYRVRVRTKLVDVCYGPLHWSEWSPTAVLEPSHYMLDPLVIVLISLGVPMILLAVLLLVRHQRLSKVLFPPIPRPPPKYKYFLERSDPQNFFRPAPPVKSEEEITEVEDADQNPP